MTSRVHQVLREITAPEADGSFHVRRLPGYPAYFIGRDAVGSPALLARTTGPGRTVPLRLAGIEASFGVLCKLAEPGLPEQTETLTVILCRSREAGIETYFASIIESMLLVLDSAPTIPQMVEIIDKLVELFQKLRHPARRPLSGLVGELCLIHASRSNVAAVNAWRMDADERYDFVAGRVRLDSKASTNRSRSHGVSYEQANPPPGAFGLIASVWIEAAAGGTSLDELLASIEARIMTDHAALGRLRAIVADTLGEAILAGLDWRFDLELAVSSLAFYDAAIIPAVRPPLPTGVSSIRFVSELVGCRPLDIEAFSTSIDENEAAILP